MNYYEKELYGYRVGTAKAVVDVEDTNLEKLKALLAFSWSDGWIAELITIRTPEGEVVAKSVGETVFILTEGKEENGRRTQTIN